MSSLHPEVSHVVLVTTSRQVLLDDLIVYFQQESIGGGDVDESKTKVLGKTNFSIYFEDDEVAATVLQNTHTIQSEGSSVEVNVSPYTIEIAKQHKLLSNETTTGKVSPASSSSDSFIVLDKEGNEVEREDDAPSSLKAYPQNPQSQLLAERGVDSDNQDRVKQTDEKTKDQFNSVEHLVESMSGLNLVSTIEHEQTNKPDEKQVKIHKVKNKMDQFERKKGNDGTQVPPAEMYVSGGDSNAEPNMEQESGKTYTSGGQNKDKIQQSHPSQVLRPHSLHVRIPEGGSHVHEQQLTLSSMPFQSLTQSEEFRLKPGHSPSPVNSDLPKVHQLGTGAKYAAAEERMGKSSLPNLSCSSAGHIDEKKSARGNPEQTQSTAFKEYRENSQAQTQPATTQNIEEEFGRKRSTGHTNIGHLHPNTNLTGSNYIVTSEDPVHSSGHTHHHKYSQKPPIARSEPHIQQDPGHSAGGHAGQIHQYGGPQEKMAIPGDVHDPQSGQSSPWLLHSPLTGDQTKQVPHTTQSIHMPNMRESADRGRQRDLPPRAEQLIPQDELIQMLSKTIPATVQSQLGITREQLSQEDMTALLLHLANENTKLKAQQQPNCEEDKKKSVATNEAKTVGVPQMGAEEENLPHLQHEKEVVEERTTNAKSSDPGKRILVEVTMSGPTEHFEDEELKFLFESAKHTGGGDTDKFYFDRDKKKLTIGFEKNEDAQGVLKNGSFDYKGVKFTPTLYQSPKPNQQHQKHAHKHSHSSTAAGLEHFEGPPPEAISTLKEEVPESQTQIQQDPLVLPHQLSEEEEQKSDEHIGTIEVRGFKETTTDEVIKYFFESKKRSGGGQIKSMEMKRKENKACITFEDAKVASQIIQRGALTLEDTPLQICELLVPQKPAKVKTPFEPNKLLLRGLLPTTSPDCLRLFVEYISEQDTFDIVYGPQPGVILVTFQEKIEFGVVQSRIQKKKNKQTSEFGNVDAAQVYFPSAVQVHGLPPTTTKDALEMYLEAQCGRDAQHAEVIQLDADKRYAVVEFSDYRDIGQLLTKEHRIAGQVITLSAYYPFFGETSPAWDSSSPHLPTPGPVIVKVNPAFLNYVQKHPQVHGRKFADVLEKAHAQAQFTDDGELRLSCTITDGAPDAFALIRTWEQDAVLKVQDFFQHYSHEVFQIQPDAWNNVVERIAEKHLVESCDIIVDMDPDTMKITLTGENEMVMLLSNQVKAIHDAEMKAIEREREKIKDDISLDEYKLRLLLALNFLNNMEEQFHDLSTKIDLKNGIISFEGVQADVRNAKLQMYERITTLVEGKVSLSQLMIDFLKFQACQDYLDQCLKSSEVVAVWTFGDKEISLYAQSRDQLETANAIILREVQEKTSELNAESKPLLKSKKWQKMCDSLNKDYPGLLKISSSATHYTITALKKDMQNILGRIDRFLEENTILAVFEPMEYGRVSYMKNYMIEGLSNITASLKPSVISVEADNTKSKPGILVKGTKDGLKEIMPTIKELSSSVQKCSHPVGKPGMPKFFSEKKGQSLLEGVALRTKTIIEVNQPEETTPRVITGKRENQEAVETRVVKSQVDHSSGKKFLVCKGDMSKYPVDVVVNAANDRLEHTGGLAGALLRAGGKAIQEESKKFLERHGWSRLMEGQIAWTGPGKLPCKLIIHGVGPMWEGDKAGKERLLKEVVYKAFEKANQDDFKSIAFPAISSGIFGYPVDKSTRAIVEAADMSCSENPSSSLKEIHFVDTSDSTVDLFSKAVHSVLGISSQLGQPKTRYSGSPTLREDTRGDDTAQWQDPDDIDTDDELQAAVAGARGSRRTTQNTDFQPGPSPDSVETAEGITVTLVKGQLAQQQVDVIVNTTHQSLNLGNGAVSKSILVTAGPQIQQECSNKYPGGVRFGDVAPTRGYGRLQCKMVYHGACCNYDGGKGQSEQVLRQFIQNCLNELSRTGFLSIAFPAIGTGNLGFPKDLVAKAMFEEIKNFSSANSRTSLKDVLFVIYEKDFPLIKAFEDELQRVQGKGGMGAKPKRKRKSKAGTSEGGGSLYTNLTSHTPGGYQMKIGKICVQIQKDDITKENVGAIVNSSNPTLDLSMGGVSKAIVNSGGSAILDECRKKGQTMGGLALTGAGKLKCKYIIHFDAQVYFHGKWKEAVIKCLEMAESLGLKSVAFPALGTGALGYNNNPESIASYMLEGIADFYINVNPVNVMLVRITLFQPHLLPIFQKVMKNKHGTPLKDNRGILKKVWDTVRRHSWKGSEVLEREKKVLVLDIYAKDKKSSDAAVQGIEDIVRDEMEDRMITDDEIARFSPEQVDRLRDLEKKLDVQMNIEILGVNRVNRIRIQGHKQDVAKVVEEYHKILRELKDHDLKIAEAEACAKEVMWMYIDGGKNYQYDIILNADIEKAYQANKRGRYKYKNEDGQTLEINFVKMEEIMSGDTTSGIKVLRKNLKEMQNLPNHWSPMPMGQSQVSIPIDMSTREYRKVMTKLMKTSQGSINQIFKIERIQNPTLYKSYMVKKEDMETRNPGLQNVRELFHGTSEETLPSINNTGFNRSYCGKNATMYGRGVYFATQSVYAARDQYARPNSNGERHIYLAKVLTGDYTAGNQSLIVPPLKQGSQHFDSVVDDPNNPGIFVIFSDNQAYPEYLITFN